MPESNHKISAIGQYMAYQRQSLYRDLQPPKWCMWWVTVSQLGARELGVQLMKTRLFANVMYRHFISNSRTFQRKLQTLYVDGDENVMRRAHTHTHSCMENAFRWLIWNICINPKWIKLYILAKRQYFYANHIHTLHTYMFMYTRAA